MIPGVRARPTLSGHYRTKGHIEKTPEPCSPEGGKPAGTGPLAGEGTRVAGVGSSVGFCLGSSVGSRP
jgi:hypothetical protein